MRDTAYLPRPPQNHRGGDDDVEQRQRQKPQPSRMSWSGRKRGSVQRMSSWSQHKNRILSDQATTWISTTARCGRWKLPKPDESRPGTCQPPRNTVVTTAERKIVSMNSAKEDAEAHARILDEVTDQLGLAFGRSNGARLVSAIAAVKNSTNASGCVTMPQLRMFEPLRSTIAFGSSEP